MKYQIPHFTQDDLYEPDRKAWINFFGQDWLYTTKERIKKILDINNSVFQDDSYFSEHILELFEQQYLSKKMNNIVQTPRDYYSRYLSPYDFEIQKNVHHIIFQNDCMWWHISYKDNRIDMERWIHSSFHKLLNNKNIYPHEQISRFLKIENEYLDKRFVQRLQKIEQSYTQLFKTKPFEVYKPECLSYEFHKQHKKEIV